MASQQKHSQDSFIWWKYSDRPRVYGINSSIGWLKTNHGRRGDKKRKNNSGVGPGRGRGHPGFTVADFRDHREVSQSLVKYTHQSDWFCNILTKKISQCIWPKSDRGFCRSFFGHYLLMKNASELENEKCFRATEFKFYSRWKSPVEINLTKRMNRLGNRLVRVSDFSL